MHVKASTLTDYQSLIRNHLGNSNMWDTSVDQISRTMIEDFLAQKRRNLSASTTKHIRTVIKQSLDRADLPVNPCSGVKVLERKRTNGKHKISVYTESEVEHLLETLGSMLRDITYWYCSWFEQVAGPVRWRPCNGMTSTLITE